MKNLSDLVRMTGRAPVGGRRVTEQGIGPPPPLQGVFDVVVVRWRDITAHMVQTGGAPDEDQALSGGEEGGMIEFLQVGILAKEDEDRIVILHSMSMEPNRSEFFIFPKEVVVKREVIGQIRIDGDDFQAVG